MNIRKITASLSVLCVLGSVIALNSGIYSRCSVSATAAYFDSGEFGDGLRWEYDDEGILRFSGNGEITEWPWVEYEPRIYSQFRIREVILGSGITKVGFVDYSDYGLDKITILNPECIICETPDNADPEESGVISNVRYDGCIYGFSGSTAQTYAERHGFKFEEIDKSSVRKAGDINLDGDFNIADVVLFQKWLIAVPDTELADWKAGDFCNDDILDVFDLCIMKCEYLKQGG